MEHLLCSGTMQGDTVKIWGKTGTVLSKVLELREGDNYEIITL